MNADDYSYWVKEGLIIAILLSIAVIAGKMALVSLGLIVW